MKTCIYLKFVLMNNKTYFSYYTNTWNANDWFITIKNRLIGSLPNLHSSNGELSFFLVFC